MSYMMYGWEVYLSIINLSFPCSILVIFAILCYEYLNNYNLHSIYYCL